MNTIQLECFLAVAEHLNFSKASQALKLTQPAVSHQIQTLEEELGVKLFIRTSRNVELTQEGILFMPDADLILKTALSARERLGKHEHFIPFDLGCHNHLELNLLPPILKKLAEEFPLLRPSMHLVPFPSLLGRVENSQLLAALGTKEEQKKSSLSFRKLCSALLPVSVLRIIRCRISVSCPQPAYGKFYCLLAPADSGLRIHGAQPDPDPSAAGKPVSHRQHRKRPDHGEGLFWLYPVSGHPISPEPGLCYIPVTDLPKVSFGVYFRHNNDHPVLKRFIALIPQMLMTGEIFAQALPTHSWICKAVCLAFFLSIPTVFATSKMSSIPGFLPFP